MIFALTLTGDQDGSANSPQVSKFKLTRGLIYKVEVEFYAGSAGLMHVYMEYEGVQIYPTRTGENFFGNSVIISFEDTRWINTEPFEIDVYYWNEDDTYDHIFQLRIGLVSADDLIRRYVPSDMVADMKEIIELEAKEAVKTSQSKLSQIFDIVRGSKS